MPPEEGAWMLCIVFVFDRFFSSVYTLIIHPESKYYTASYEYAKTCGEMLKRLLCWMDILLNSRCLWGPSGCLEGPVQTGMKEVSVVKKRLTCSFRAGVLWPAAAGSCSGGLWGQVGSAAAWLGCDAALAFPSLFSCGCLASESAPDSVVMVNHTVEERRKRWVSWLARMIWCTTSGLVPEERWVPPQHRHWRWARMWPDSRIKTN